MKHPILVGLAAFGWRTGILFLALTTAAVMTFGTPEAFKTALRDSGAYQTASSQLAERAGSAVGQQFGTGVDQKAIDDIAAANITPESLRKSAESNIDNAYGWLEGKTDEPDIKLDLQPYVDGFLKGLGDQTMKRAASLPNCIPEQLRAIDPVKIDITNLPCRPPGVNLETIKDQTLAQAVQSNEFLRNPVISLDSLPEDTEGKTAVDRLDYLPTAYSWAMRGPWIFGILALVSGAAIFWFLRDDRRLATRKIGRSLLGTGLTLAILALAIGWLLTSSMIKLPDDQFSDIALAFAQSIEKTAGGKVLCFGIVYSIVGAAILIALRFTRPTAVTDGNGASTIGAKKPETVNQTPTEEGDAKQKDSPTTVSATDTADPVDKTDDKLAS